MRSKDFASGRAAPLTFKQKAIMLTSLLRSSDIFLSVREHLKPEFFNEYEQSFRLVWIAICQHFETHAELPSENLLYSAVESLIHSSLDNFPDGFEDEVNQLLNIIFNLPEEDCKPKVGKALLSDFLREKLFDKARNQLTATNDTPKNLQELFSALAEKAQAISTIGGLPVQIPFPENWRPKPLNKTTTGQPSLDKFLRGGDCEGEVYGFMGPFGSCKTTLGIQLSILRAKQSYRRWRANNKKGLVGLVYYFFYEGSTEEMRLRAISHAAQVDRTRLEDNATLSTSANLMPYEQKLFHSKLQEGLIISGERERIEQQRAVLNTCWRLVDMTGNDPNRPLAGGGLYGEIRDTVAADLQANPNTYVAGIYVDYVGACVERHISLRGKNHDEMRHMIGRFPMHAVNMLAVPFSCPVWLLHQLSGKANSKSVGTKQHHTDASESKSFGENCAFCFQVSAPTNENLVVLTCSKHRRAPPLRETVLRIDGSLATVRDVSGEYVVQNNSIIRAAELNQIANASPFRAMTLGSNDVR